MRAHRVLALVFFFVFFVVLGPAAGGRAAAQSAPVPLAPATGGNVQVPFSISWSAVLDPGQLNGGYNWQLSPSSSFSPLVRMDSTNPATTQDTVSGLTAGTYFWRVQAVNGAAQASAFSTARSFNVTGAGPGTPGTPVLAPTRGYSTFHPWEAIHFDWSAVPVAVSYRLEVSNNASFPLGTVPAGTVTFWNDNIPTNSDGYVHTIEGNWFARVFAVDADNPEGIRSLPSNVIQFSCFFNNPIGPPPALLSPVSNPTLTLPVTLSWAHVPNPQPSGYVLEVAKDSVFSNVEFSFNQYTEPTTVMLSLTSGPKFWRVLSQHGLSSPTTNANTAWSTTGRFTISSAPATPVSIAPLGTPGFVYSGGSGMVAVQLTAGVPAAGATIAMTSSHPSVAPIPSSLAMQGTHAWAQFPIQYGQVTTATLVTLTATLNGVSASNSFTVRPPTLNDDILQPGPLRATGGTSLTGWVDLEGGGVSGAGGFVVNLSDSSPAVTVPATVTIPAGVNGTGFSIQTSSVTVTTPVTITASAGGVTTRWQITLEPGAAPTGFFVRPISTTSGSQGVVNTSEGVGFDQLMQVTSSNPALASVPSTVTVFAGSGVGFFDITTAAVTTPTSVTISVTGGGVTLSRPLTLHPSLPALTSLSVSPTSVAGGNPAIGTVRLASPAPSVGLSVNLGSNLPPVARVPESVTIPGGATSATFTVTTFPSATTTVQLSATLDSVFQFAAITVGPPAPPATPGTPSLLAPANLATVAQPIAFDWSDASSAVTYEIQIDSSSSFTTPLTLTQTVSASQATIGGLPAQQLFWRVRGISSAGVNGPFSAARRFTPQAAPAAASLSALSLSPTSVVGGSGSTGTATLTSAAPAGGLVVSLSSSNAAASVPASVTLAAGATSATFAVTTSSVASSTAVTLTGTGGGATRTTTLTVNPVPPPASLSSIAMSPSSVTGGSSSTGTATLTSAAPAGGLVVSLSSSNAAASVPASVTLAAGATSATFAVTTSSVASSTAVTLTGTGGGATRTTTLTVNPVQTGPLPAPSQVAPASDARFSPGQGITFDWSDVAGAASYTLQIDDDSSFPAPFVLQQNVGVSQFSSSTLPTRTLWWRARASDAAGNPGSWSSVRRFEVKN